MYGVSCLKCGKGAIYDEFGRQSKFCNNPDCSFVLAIEDEMRGNRETDLTELPEHIIQGMIRDNRIPKNWRDGYKALSKIRVGLRSRENGLSFWGGYP